MAWIDAYFFGIKQVAIGGTLLAQEKVINFIGATAVDNPAQGRTDVTVGGGSVPTGSGLYHDTAGTLDAAAYKGTANQVLVTNAGATDTAWASIGGDITGTIAALVVSAISGASPLPITPATLQWLAATANPTIKVADNTTASATGTTTTYGGQNCTGVTSTGGAVALRSGSGTTAAGAINAYLGASGAPIMTLAATAADLGGGNYPVVLDASGGAGNGVVAKVGGVSVASLQQVAGDFAAFGVNPSATGAVRLANALAIKARNVGNTADYQLIASDSSNNVIVGSTTTPANVNVFGTPASSLLIADGFLGCYFGSGATGFVFRSNGGTNGVAVLGSTTSAAWTWDSAQTAPTWTQATLGGTGANAGATSTLQAQAGQAQTGAVANNNGGGFNIKTGAAGTGGSGAAGLPGVLGLFVGATQVSSIGASDANDYLALGSEAAGAMSTVGAIRLSNGTNGIWYRNALGTTNGRLIQNDGSGNVYIGDATVGQVLFSNFGNTQNFQIGGVTQLAITATRVNFATAPTTTTAPAAGGAGALPATPKGYMTVQRAGVDVQIAYY